MHGQRIARQQELHEPSANQAREVRGAACMHDHRAGDDRDPPAIRLDGLHHLGDADHGRLDAALGRHLVRHERKAMAIAILKRRHDADSFDAADDDVALPDVPQFPA